MILESSPGAKHPRPTKFAKLSILVADNCTAIVLSIAILLAGLRVASGAPAGEIKWWKNPCDRHVTFRHGRSTAENQLSSFLHKMNTTFFRDIKLMYKVRRSIVFPYEKLILPFFSVRRQREVQGYLSQDQKRAGSHQTSFIALFCKYLCLNLVSNFAFAFTDGFDLLQANQAFYYTLQQFAEFFEKLKDTPITAEGNFNVTRRTTNFERAEQHLKLLMCEYNETIKNENSGADHKDSNGNAATITHPSQISKDCLPASMDESHARYADMDFFKKLQKFLKQSRRILMKKKKKENRTKRIGEKSVSVVRKAKGGRRTKKRTL